ncbi:LacI family DNA-binding transcriptional regulator [Lutibacter citreus]|uniref:LacI family DNA-binding transcriptional regulator n=1 Tax=Lutibacter citreus TaxID=2138210 RepID=UPI000DBE0EB6|nr:LacI family DNA-binding transcriptional regulator [Lutibacter citreus]
MNKGKITIHDISKNLGIDSSTVSRALNDSPRVSKKTKEKILKKAEELGYQRNSLASKLRTNRTNTIGVIVPRISRHFFASVISGIEETAFDAGYEVIICQSLDSYEREKKLVDTLLSNRVDGILISISMGTTNYDHFENYKNNGFPIIFFDRPCEVSKNTNIIIDDLKASLEATEHLILNGCKNIAHFSGPQTIELYRRRYKGYIAALEKYNFPIREEFIFESNLMKQDGIQCAKEILKLPEIDGVFSANDVTAISAMQYLKTQGKKLPEDIAFVGFSNEPISAVIEPSLTTINQPDFEMGKVASTLLFNQINNKTVLNQTTILEPELIIRKSSIKN